MKDLEAVHQYLLDVVHRPSFDEQRTTQARAILVRIKQRAVKCDNQEKATQVWCYETILNIQDYYLSAFESMKQDSFFEAWCLLERVEVALAFLSQHFEPEGDEYMIRFIEKHTSQFQSLFPYTFFASPAMLHLREKCSICGKPISIRNPCGHKPGEIYNGEMCGHEITEMQVLEVSITQKPAHKYAVMIPVNSDTGSQEDGYDYALVKYVVARLRSPFYAWHVHWTKIRHPHSRFRHVGRNDPCPCGSGKKYKLCCLRESGVLYPHVEVSFSVPPSESLPSTMHV